MSYPLVEQSVQDGQPYFLYAFDDGTTVTRLTSDSLDLTKMTFVWSASAMKHADIEQAGNVEKASLELEFPLSDTFARLFLSPIAQVITVTIWRGHHTDLTETHRVVWKGRVVGAKTRGQSLSVEIESVFTSLRRPGCRARYQRTCRFALYDTGCNLAIASFQTALNLTAMNGLVLTVSGAGSAPAGHYIAGVLAYNGLYGFIVGHSGDSITLMAPVPGLQAAFDLTSPLGVLLAPGCNLSRDHCETKFNNEENFGGFPYMPDNNPFSISII